MNSTNDLNSYEISSLKYQVEEIDNLLKDFSASKVKNETRIETIESDVKDIKISLDEVNGLLTKAKGIWAFLGWVVSSLAFLAGLLAFFWNK